MNQDAINRDLREKESHMSPFQQAVIEQSENYVKASLCAMSEYYDCWDNNNDIYRGYRLLDRNDKEALEKKEPAKIVVPITFAQVQTAISFIFSTILQREHIFELRGMGPEDVKLVFGLETDLQYQMDKNHAPLMLYNWLLDSFKVGFGVVKCDWSTDYAKMRVAKQVPAGGMAGMFGQLFGRPPKMKMEESVESVLCYEGNRIRNVSPYSFLPDPSVTLSRFQEGLFVAHEEEVSKRFLENLEGRTYHGTNHIDDRSPIDLYDDRRRAGKPSSSTDPTSPSSNKTDAKAVVLTEIQFSMVPADWTERFKSQGVNFGTGKDAVKYVAVIANGKKVIRFEPMGYLHDQFSYAMSEYSPDHTVFLNPGLADTIYELQNLITFFLNSHVVNVRKIIQNRFLVDPSKVEMDDLKSNAMAIRTKGTQVSGLDRVLKQLEVFDVTKGHVQDMDVLAKLVQLVTGVSENALGQYASGRRSATEARNVNAGSGARLKMHATLFNEQGLGPLGRMMLANTRQGRSQKVYEQILGAEVVDAPYEQTILADPEKLAGGFDFIPYDATLPSDRQQQAGVLTELFTVLLQNPDTMQLLNKNPLPLLEHIAKLHNIKNLRDFDALPVNPMQAAPTAQVVPDQTARDMASSGQGEEVDISGASLLNSLAQA